jgi:hypothetical protein
MLIRLIQSRKNGKIIFDIKIKDNLIFSLILNYVYIQRSIFHLRTHI